LAVDWHELIGPLSSLFWLAGFDDLVEAVYDPAIVMQDEVRMIPIKVGVIWILEHLYDEGLLPERLYIKYYFDDEPRSVRVMPVRIDPIPPAVGPNPAIHTLSDLFTVYRPQCIPQKLGTARIKSGKSKHKLALKIQNEYLSKLGGGSFLCSLSPIELKSSFRTLRLHSTKFAGIRCCFGANLQHTFGQKLSSTTRRGDPSRCLKLRSVSGAIIVTSDDYLARLTALMDGCLGIIVLVLL
jgi:hypothetical protein